VLGDYLGDGCWWWVVMELCVGSWVMMECWGIDFEDVARTDYF